MKVLNLLKSKTKEKEKVVSESRSINLEVVISSNLRVREGD